MGMWDTSPPVVLVSWAARTVSWPQIGSFNMVGAFSQVGRVDEPSLRKEAKVRCADGHDRPRVPLNLCFVLEVLRVPGSEH